ncbi:putative Ricin B-related lectin protein [Trachipleistophora hominis]|uniref:Putative Ricin B-related lectin protein n=1 Tax=Trachipleistophora hominis TaxID=72359 RepID=L7JWG9_TRAHO|nr:putative Ricin B-related lectin protein [Trachipleistophora hominis]
MLFTLMFLRIFINTLPIDSFGWIKLHHYNSNQYLVEDNGTIKLKDIDVEDVEPFRFIQDGNGFKIMANGRFLCMEKHFGDIHLCTDEHAVRWKIYREGEKNYIKNDYDGCLKVSKRNENDHNIKVRRCYDNSMFHWDIINAHGMDIHRDHSYVSNVDSHRPDEPVLPVRVEYSAPLPVVNLFTEDEGIGNESFGAKNKKINSVNHEGRLDAHQTNHSVDMEESENDKSDADDDDELEVKPKKVKIDYPMNTHHVVETHSLINEPAFHEESDTLKTTSTPNRIGVQTESVIKEPHKATNTIAIPDDEYILKGTETVPTSKVTENNLLVVKQPVSEGIDSGSTSNSPTDVRPVSRTGIQIEPSTSDQDITLNTISIPDKDRHVLENIEKVPVSGKTPNNLSTSKQLTFTKKAEEIPAVSSINSIKKQKAPLHAVNEDGVLLHHNPSRKYIPIRHVEENSAVEEPTKQKLNTGRRSKDKIAPYTSNQDKSKRPSRSQSGKTSTNKTSEDNYKDESDSLMEQVEEWLGGSPTSKKIPANFSGTDTASNRSDMKELESFIKRNDVLFENASNSDDFNIDANIVAKQSDKFKENWKNAFKTCNGLFCNEDDYENIDIADILAGDYDDKIAQISNIPLYVCGLGQKNHPAIHDIEFC